MSIRLRPRDRLILAAFVTTWVVLLAMKLSGVNHPFSQPVVVRHDHYSGVYPVVTEILRPSVDRPTQLLVGDRLVRIGDITLANRAQLDVLVAFARAGSTAAREVPVVLIRDGVERTISEPMPYRVGTEYVVGAIVSAWSAVVAVLILLRARPSQGSYALFAAMASDALIYNVRVDAPPPYFQVVMVLGFILLLFHAPLVVRALMAFPVEAKGLAGWRRFVPWVFPVMSIPVFSAFFGIPLGREGGVEWSRVTIFASTLTIVIAMTRNFRNSGPTGRRQIKWLLYAVYVGALTGLIREASVDMGTLDEPLWSILLLIVAKTIFPAAILIAATRHDLLDIDRLLGSTVLYNVLAAFALGVGFLLVPRVADALTATLDLNRTIGQSGLTLALAVVVLVVGRRLRPVVERWFFRERFALEQAMRELPERFAGVRTADELWELTGTELAKLVRPTVCVIYTSGGQAMLPAFVSGDSRAPSVAMTSSFSRWVASLSGARRVDRKDETRLDAADRALLQELEALVVIPIHRKGALEAMIVLGEKRSGDIYTSTDLALLTGLGKTLSSHMLRFDEAELLSRARTLQEKMRRYVPGALADAIAEGEELETGERDVCVLFVDIRGYTAYADGREAREIFSTVNRYTEAVSSIVRDAGGSVVEFNGDGMMAVFGAPRALTDKEAAAVRCAVRLSTEIPLLGVTEQSLAVGVGVATGSAFVGNIEAVDRTIWSAIGSTTNLAARLQALTKERQASVLIDETTYQRAGESAAAFELLAAETIRGVSAPMTLYALKSTQQSAIAGAMASATTTH